MNANQEYLLMALFSLFLVLGGFLKPTVMPMITSLSFGVFLISCVVLMGPSPKVFSHLEARYLCVVSSTCPKFRAISLKFEAPKERLNEDLKSTKISYI